MEGFEALLTIKDQMSGPLSNITKQLTAYDRELTKLDVLQRKAAAGGNEELSKSLKKQYDGLRLNKDELALQVPAAEGFKKEIAAAGGAVLAAVAAITVMVLGLKELASIIFDATEKIVKFTVASAAMREQLIANYTMFTRDAVQAERTFNMIDDIANSMHIPRQKTHDYAKGLLEAGVKPQLELQRSVKAIGIMQKVGGEGAAKSLESKIGQLSKTRVGMGGRSWGGMFSISTEELRSMGLTWENMTDALRSRTGKAVTVMDLQMGRVRISADKGIAALQDAIGAKHGETAAGIIGGFPELIDHAQQVWQKFTEDVGKSKGFKEFMKTLYMIVDAFEVLGQKGGKSGFSGTLDMGLHLVAKGLQLALTGFLYLLIFVQKLVIVALQLALSFKAWAKQGDNITTLKGIVLGFLLAATVAVGVLTLAVLLLGAALFILFLPLIITFGIVAAGFIIIGIVIAKIIKNFSTWKDAAKKAVTDLVDGLVSGMTKGVKTITDAAKGLGKAALTGVSQALEIHSPSRAMQRLGVMTAEGFQKGLDGGAVLDVGAKLPRGLGSGGKGMSFTWNGDLNIGDAGQHSRDELKRMTEDAIADALERVMLEYGM